MKKLIVAVAAASSLFLGSAFAGNWAHAQTSPGNYGGSANPTSIAHVQQILQAFNGSYTVWVNDGSVSGHYESRSLNGIATNSGPLGYYVVTSGPQQTYQGDVAAGSYWIYQQVIDSGYSVTTFSW